MSCLLVSWVKKKQLFIYRWLCVFVKILAIHDCDNAMRTVAAHVICDVLLWYFFLVIISVWLNLALKKSQAMQDNFGCMESEPVWALPCGFPSTDHSCPEGCSVWENHIITYNMFDKTKTWQEFQWQHYSNSFSQCPCISVDVPNGLTSYLTRTCFVCSFVLPGGVVREKEVTAAPSLSAESHC